MSDSTTSTSTIKMRYFRENSEEIIDAVKKGKVFTIFKRSKPVLKLSKPDVDEWGEEVGPNDITIDFRKDGITADEFFEMMKKDMKKKQKHER